jgi:hypothetical protein
MPTIRRPQAVALRAQEVWREWLALIVLASALSLITIHVLA